MNNKDLFELGMKCATFDGNKTADPDELFPGWNNNRDFNDSSWKPPIVS